MYMSHPGTVTQTIQVLAENNKCNHYNVICINVFKRSFLVSLDYDPDPPISTEEPFYFYFNSQDVIFVLSSQLNH